MTCCPSCRESRWIYPRRHPLGAVAKHLTGWTTYKCKECGWRGWGTVPQSERAPLRVLYVQGREHAAIAIRRLAATAKERAAALPRQPRARVAIGLIAAILIALVAAGVLFSAQKPSRERIEPPPPDQQQAASPQATAPAVVPAVEASRVEALPAALPVNAPATPSETSVRPESIARPAVRRPAVASAAASNLPKYRGSLAITSDPAGAMVTIDGQAIGTTPLVLKDVRAGSRVVRIESSGYEKWSAATRVVADKETRVNATLQRGSQ
jgi:hypothetical protein